MTSLLHFDRRQFLQACGAAAMTGMTSSPIQALPPEEDAVPKATADSVILLWMAGGMAHTETFDPKRHTPFRPGVRAEEVLSTFPAIDTSVDGLQIASGFERVARIMDRGTLVRSHVGADLGHILHSRHQYHWHTGYEPPLTVAAPHLGAWIAQALGPRNDAVPALIDIGQPYAGNGEAEELKAFQTAGFLGSEFGPFRIPDPSQAIQSVRPPAGMSLDRFRRRYEAYRRLLEKSPLSRATEDHQRASLERSLNNAYRLLSSPAAGAFDLEKEPREKFDVYNTGRFGQGCLLARRLIESGARFVEVTTEYVPFKWWDTHDNGHTRLRDLKNQIDAPIAQLILDLEERNLLDRTLVVLASEFSRDMLIEGKPDVAVPNQVNQPAIINELKHYGMHRHFTGAGSVLLFGGGIRQGYVHGKTADERPCTTIENPVTVTDLHATIYRALGIAPDYGVEIEKRPFYVTRDGHGKPVEALFA